MADEINFLSCGQVGDLIHQLFVVKSMCLQNNTCANLYIADFSYGLCACGNFTLDLEKTYLDTKDIIKSQDYISKYEILSRDFDSPLINLNIWRDMGNFKSWTDLLSDSFSVKKIIPNKFMSISRIDESVINKILIHNSDKRHNNEFPWNEILENIMDDILFITSDISEYERFRHKKENIKPYLVSTVSDMVNSIGSCKLFIGNQSAPLAIASALDVPRVAELHSSSYEFYINEHSYSENLSWFVNNNHKFNSKKINIKI